jgi:hypothetical protein
MNQTAIDTDTGLAAEYRRQLRSVNRNSHSGSGDLGMSNWPVDDRRSLLSVSVLARLIQTSGVARINDRDIAAAA